MMQHDEKYTKFLNLLQDSILIIDAEGIVTFANHQALHMLGIGRDGLIGQPLKQKLIIQTELGKSANVDTLLIYPTLKEQKTIVIDRRTVGEFSIIRGDRSQFPASIRTLPYSVTGEDGGMTIIFYDISHEEKIEQSKSEFVSLVSHQLRTPVNITSWYTEKLLSQKRGNLNEKQKEYLDEISVSNKRITDLVASIVNVSRTDLDRLKSKHERVELIGAIQEQVHFFKELIASKDITCNVNLGFDEFILKESDREYIMVALHGVLNNAIKYSHQGGVVSIAMAEVVAGVEIDPKSGFVTKHHGAIISVKDSGLGIPDEQQPQVFEKLFRADNVKALDVTGLGLALYISRSFIESLDGHVWFTSVLRSGSTFYIYVPSEA